MVDDVRGHKGSREWPNQLSQVGPKVVASKLIPWWRQAIWDLFYSSRGASGGLSGGLLRPHGMAWSPGT